MSGHSFGPKMIRNFKLRIKWPVIVQLPTSNNVNLPAPLPTLGTGLASPWQQLVVPAKHLATLQDRQQKQVVPAGDSGRV